MSLQNAQFPRRSLLFMPGDSLRKIQKAAGWEVDTIIMDLEDGVAQNRKEAARETIAEALRTVAFAGRERLVRVNPINSGFLEAEIRATVAGRPDGYIAPKVEDAADLRLLDRILEQAEDAHGWPKGMLRLFAMIETARGIMNLRDIGVATTRLEGLIFGAEDLAGDIGAVRTKEAWEVFYARSAVVTAAAAYDLQAFDMIYADFHDLDGLEAESRFACRLGFTGKTCIHPNQTPVVNRVFSPRPEEVERAQRLVKTFAEQQAAGAGAFTFEGKMVDMPMLRAAERILTRAALRPPASAGSQ
ncbi:MAG: CoA ester lyase [Caldilineaceae bacterium]|nr:CoA ester lyase [Caldilineaceae bacterium]